MPLPYALFVRHELYDVLRQMRPIWRNQVIKFLETLAADPFQTGDYTEQDPSSRVLQVKIIGLWAIVYWADHPVCEVKVVHILPSDR